jgi:hypothetical protein
MSRWNWFFSSLLRLLSLIAAGDCRGDIERETFNIMGGSSAYENVRAPAESAPSSRFIASCVRLCFDSLHHGVTRFSASTIPVTWAQARKDADHILVLDNGRLVRHGTYEELNNQDGPFRHLHASSQQ